MRFNLCLRSAKVLSPEGKKAQPTRQRLSPASLGRELLGIFTGTLNQIAGTQKLEGFSLRRIFSETFRHRTIEEMEECLIVGTARTTPAITEVASDWPKPWLFARCFLLFGLSYFGFVIAYVHFGAKALAPALILMGACAGPISTLVFFFELNTPRNVSIYRLIVLVALGGIAALLISFVGYDVARLGWLSAAGAGIIEESGKLGALMLMTRGWRHKYIQNGMLLGAAVGAGFAAFESAGYAFQTSLASESGTAMLTSLMERGLLAPFMHVTWTAMVGGALWRARGSNRFGALRDRRFYGVFALAIFLHTVWNLFDHDILNLKAAALGLVAWFIIWGLVQQGLQQIRQKQSAITAMTCPGL